MKSTSRLYCSMDLHSNNVFIVVMDKDKKTFLSKRVVNDLNLIISLLEPFKANLPKIAIESTYNWYWLADGLKEHGYMISLVNTGAVKCYDGVKYTDDKFDTRFLCELQILDRLPTGFVHPPEMRSIRDLLRRSLFVRHRTAHVLSVQGLFARMTGQKYAFTKIMGYDEETLLKILGDKASVLTAQFQCDTYNHLSTKIKDIEKLVLNEIKLKPNFVKLKTIPGVGMILGMTIMLETGDISRFRKCGNFVSYCRCANSKRTSNEKVKGKNNSKNGNPHLSWAFIEAASHAIGCCPPARKYYDRKIRRTQCTALAMKSVAAKLAKAAFFVMKNQEEFDVNKAFE